MKNFATVKNLVSRRWNWRIILLNALALSVFTVYDVGILLLLHTPPTAKGFVIILLEVATFYTLLFWVLPSLGGAKQVSVFVLRLLLLAIAHLTLRISITNEVFNSASRKNVTFQQVLILLWRLIYVLNIGFLVGLFTILERQKQKEQRLKLELLEAEARVARTESALSQMRLNPHFLLGGLDYIYCQTCEALPGVAKVVDNLIEVIRYRVTGFDADNFAPLAEELLQVDNYLTIRQHFSGDKLNIVYKERIDADAAKDAIVPPFLLLTIVDNVLRHGSLYDETCPAIIKSGLEENEFYFSTSNYKTVHHNPGTGTGMASIRKVLDCCYPGRHRLEVVDDGIVYNLKLSIAL